MAMEKRLLPQEFSDVRALKGEDGIWHIPGRAIVFNKRSRKLGFFYEIIDPKACDNANFDDAISCFNHNMTHILGSVRNKTTSYNIAPDGLDYDTLPPDNPTTQDIVLAPIIRGDITGSSFMFDARGGDEWIKEPDGTIIRWVRKITTVFEWGPVSMPAYLDTTTDIAKRSFDDFIIETEKFQEQMRFRSDYAKRQLAYYQ